MALDLRQSIDGNLPQQTITLVIGNWLSLFLMLTVVVAFSLMLFWNWTNKVENRQGGVEASMHAFGAAIQLLTEDVRTIKDAVLLGKTPTTKPQPVKPIIPGVVHGKDQASAPQ